MATRHIIGRATTKSSRAVGFGGKRAVPHAPAQAAVPSSSTTTNAPPVDPRDAAYYNAVAKLQFQANQQLAGLDQQDAYATADLRNALDRLHAQQPIAQQNTENTANAQGLFYSGQLGSRLGQLNAQYAQQEGDMDQNAQRAQAARAAARNAIQQGLPLSTAAALAAAVDRQSARDAANPPQDVTEPTAAPATPAAPPARKPTAPKAPRTTTPRARFTQRLAGRYVGPGRAY